MKNKIIIDYKTPEQEERETQLMVMTSKEILPQHKINSKNGAKKKTISAKSLEIAKPGYSNGISLQLRDIGADRSLNQDEKDLIILRASKAYGLFLDELGVDWKNDPNCTGTPLRVAKAYVEDLWKGRYNILDPITSFPSDYTGMIVETNIPLVSMCAHHNALFYGVCHIGYIPGKDGRVIGLSKLNRIVEHFSRRGQIQEDLTMQIFNAIQASIPKTIGIGVVISSAHSCVSCRGVKHQGASMQTSKLWGTIMDESSCKEEFYMHITNSYKK